MVSKSFTKVAQPLMQHYALSIRSLPYQSPYLYIAIHIPRVTCLCCNPAPPLYLSISHTCGIHAIAQWAPANHHISHQYLCARCLNKEITTNITYILITTHNMLQPKKTNYLTNNHILCARCHQMPIPIVFRYLVCEMASMKYDMIWYNVTSW